MRPAQQSPAARLDDERGTDHFGQVEARGIDRIPDEERHGTPRELFWVWAAANVNYLYIVLGGLLMVFGLNVWQGLAVVVVGNLFWAAIGFLAISGPVAGTPSSVITRSQFGIRGNRVFTGLFNWPTFIAYEAINLCLGSLAGFALADQLGLSPNKPVKMLVVVATAALTLIISVYGHATILRMSGLFTGILGLGMVVLGGYVLTTPTGATRPARTWRRSGGLALGHDDRRRHDHGLGPAVVGHLRRLRALPPLGHLQGRDRLVHRVRWFPALA